MSLGAWLAARRRYRAGVDHGPRDHRCSPVMLADNKANTTRWHPDGVAEGETAFTAVVCPICEKVWILHRTGEPGMRVWRERPRLRGRVRPPRPSGPGSKDDPAEPPVGY